MDGGAGGKSPDRPSQRRSPFFDFTNSPPSEDVNRLPKRRRTLFRESRQDATSKWVNSPVVEGSQEVARAIEWAEEQPEFVGTPNILTDPELLVYMYRLWLAENYGFDYPPQVRPALTRMQQKIWSDWFGQQEAKRTQTGPADGAVADSSAQVAHGEGENRGEDEDPWFDVENEFENGPDA